jgi:hypothetical protein
VDTLNTAVRELGIAEANLSKLVRIWSEIQVRIPEGPVFAETDPEYDARCLAFRRVLEEVPPIDGFSIPDLLYDLNDIAQMRFDAMEADDFESKLAVEQELASQGRKLGDYRIRLAQKRRQLAGLILPALLADFEEELGRMEVVTEEGQGASFVLGDWEKLRNIVVQMDSVLGESVERPKRWKELRRHLVFAKSCDLIDIRNYDWPTVRRDLARVLQEDDTPVKGGHHDLGLLVSGTTSTTIVTALQWDKIDAEAFERLLYCLLVAAPGYDNPEWLMRTNAPDRGRDISVYRCLSDSLGGTIRSRVIVQCRHWLTKAIAAPDVSALRDQVSLWEPPRVDALIIATSGWFSADAIGLIERHNQKDCAMRIEMWACSHLEQLLAARPPLVAEFKLR